MSGLGALGAVLAMAAVGVGAGLAADALMRRPAPSPGEAVAATIGELQLTVPRSFLRAGGQTAAPERIDAVLRHPDMTPGGSPAAPRGGAPDARTLVFVAVTRADGGLDPAERPQDLYGRFLEPDAWQNPGGLLLRRFQAGSPYEDEELYLSPPDGRAFTARCRKPGKGGEAVGEACLWRFRRDGADIQVRFSPDLLPQWETLGAGVRARVDGWATQAERPIAP